MGIILNPLRELLGSFSRSKDEISPLGTSEGVKVDLQTKQPALAASKDTIDRSLGILNLGLDGKIRDDLRADLIRGLKDFLANDEKLQEAFGGPVNKLTTLINLGNKREEQVAVDILDLGIPFSVKQLSLSGKPNQSLRKHLSSSSKKKVEPLDLWSKISDQSLKIILEHANRVINTELRKQDGSITEDLNLFKNEIDSLEGKINSANKSQGANPKKLLMNLITISAVGAVAVAGLEFGGVTDFTSLGPSKGATNPPAQVAKGDVMKAITGFSVENASELEKQGLEIIQGKIDGSLNQLQDQSISVTGYYGGTLKPLILENAIKGVQVQANVRTQANDQEGKPSVIIFQPGNSSTQIIIAPTEAVKANPLKQVPNNELIIVEIPLGAPGTRKPATGNLESLFNLSVEPPIK
jgi:hypothetical protein